MMRRRETQTPNTGTGPRKKQQEKQQLTSLSFPQEGTNESSRKICGLTSSIFSRFIRAECAASSKRSHRNFNCCQSISSNSSISSPSERGRRSVKIASQGIRFERLFASSPAGGVGALGCECCGKSFNLSGQPSALGLHGPWFFNFGFLVAQIVVNRRRDYE